MTYGSLLRRENGTNSLSVLQMICGTGRFEAWNNKKAVLLARKLHVLSTPPKNLAHERLTVLTTM